MCKKNKVNYLEWQPKKKPTGKNKLGDPTRIKFSEPGHHFLGNYYPGHSLTFSAIEIRPVQLSSILLYSHIPIDEQNDFTLIKIPFLRQ